jgi:RNA polymerase sigma factor (TIGR02999 family)
MGPPPGSPIARLLHDARTRQGNAADELLPIVYDQLRSLAQAYLNGERPGHTLAATALVHEAYLRLADVDIEWQDRVHFFAVAARQMRRVLVDHARARGRGKRGGGDERVPWEAALLAVSEQPVDVVDVDEALDRLAGFDARKSEIVELVYFGGLTADEVGQTLAISPATVQRELKMAKAWLHTQLKPNARIENPER